MQIDDITLKRLEKLANLTVPDARREEFKEQLGRVVEFVEVLNELDLDGVDAAVSTIGGGTPFRADEPRASGVREMILKHAPKSDGASFEVPKIIE